MNKEEIYDYLRLKNIRYEIDEHDAVYNMDELKDAKLLYPDVVAKNLFVRDDKKRQYYLISVKGDKKVDLKRFKEEYGTRPLSFVSSEDMMRLLKVKPGCVSPLGLLNDDDEKIIFYLDEDYLDGIIGCHPNDNTATIYLETSDLIDIIKEHGNVVSICSIKERV